MSERKARGGRRAVLSCCSCSTLPGTCHTGTWPWCCSQAPARDLMATQAVVWGPQPPAVGGSPPILCALVLGGCLWPPLPSLVCPCLPSLNIQPVCGVAECWLPGHGMLERPGRAVLGPALLVF